MEDTQAQHGSFQLFSLADELILSIIEQIDSHHALCSLAATCSRLQSLTEPFIWRSLLVLTGSHVGKLVQAFDQRPERLSSIQELAIQYDQKDEEGIEKINPCLRQMVKLRHLTIESPCPNNHGGGAVRLFTFPSWTRIDYTALFLESVYSPQLPPLSNLQSITLHGHRSVGEPFTFGQTAIIFLHTTVRSITISCSNFHAEMGTDRIPEKMYNSTPLESLTFIECNVYLPFLDTILRLPKALKELSIGERLYSWDGCHPSPHQPRTTEPDFINVLQRQAHSLERLVHVAGNLRWHRPGHQNENIHGGAMLRNLFYLKHLELSVDSRLMHYLRDSGFPDSLQSLRLSDAAITLLPTYDPTTSPENVIGVAYGLVIKRFSRPIDLEICFTSTRGRQPQEGLQKLWSSSRPGHENQRSRMKVYSIATILKARGGRFRILAEQFGANKSFIPPYMYGEDTPEEILVYDSDNLWALSGEDYRAYDDEDLPRELRATCLACRRSRNMCTNSGYGTQCWACASSDIECEYPPPDSPWVVNNTSWQEEQEQEQEQEQED